MAGKVTVHREREQEKTCGKIRRNSIRAKKKRDSKREKRIVTEGHKASQLRKKKTVKPPPRKTGFKRALKMPRCREKRNLGVWEAHCK